MIYIEIESENDLLKLVESNTAIEKYAFQNLNFHAIRNLPQAVFFNDCIFLGCNIPDTLSPVISSSCLTFPQIEMPFNPFINKLYSKEILYDKYELGKPETYGLTHDKIVYRHYMKNGKEADDIKETLARRLHDHSITDALYDFLSGYEDKKIVAIMGGHGLLRNDPDFLEIAKISKTLTENGYLMISGGGPGAMEATHIGAWFAGKKETEMLLSIHILAQAPAYNHPLWLDKAFEVLEQFPETGYESVGIPTWLYGHEPPTPFATKIAKYFANSVREDGLLAIAKGGVIFSPGSAGTIQEIFQDATQNHYESLGFASPMVFYNQHYWTVERPVFPFLQQMASEGKYKNLILSVYDNPADIVNEIKKFTQDKAPA